MIFKWSTTAGARKRSANKIAKFYIEILRSFNLRYYVTQKELNLLIDPFDWYTITMENVFFSH